MDIIIHTVRQCISVIIMFIIVLTIGLFLRHFFFAFFNFLKRFFFSDSLYVIRRTSYSAPTCHEPDIIIYQCRTVFYGVHTFHVPSLLSGKMCGKRNKNIFILQIQTHFENVTSKMFIYIQVRTTIDGCTRTILPIDLYYIDRESFDVRLLSSVSRIRASETVISTSEIDSNYNLIPRENKKYLMLFGIYCDNES